MKKHLLNIRKNCGLKKCGEEMGKQCIMLARGQEEKMVPGKPGARKNVLVHDMAGSHTHTHRKWHALPWPIQSGGPDSWTSCPDYTQTRRWKFPTSHQNWTTSSQVSPKAALATFPPWELPEALTLPQHLWELRLGLLLGLRFSFYVFVCLFITDK